MLRFLNFQIKLFDGCHLVLLIYLYLVFFNLVAISTQSKLIFGMLDKVSFVCSVSNIISRRKNQHDYVESEASG